MKWWLGVRVLWAVSSCQLYGCSFTQSNFDTAVEHLHWSCTLQRESPPDRNKTLLSGAAVDFAPNLNISQMSTWWQNLVRNPSAYLLHSKNKYDFLMYAYTHMQKHFERMMCSERTLSPLCFPGAQQSPPVAAQDLTSVFKAGYLEKRRKGECSAIPIMSARSLVVHLGYF